MSNIELKNNPTTNRHHPFKTSAFFREEGSKICRWIVVKKIADGRGRKSPTPLMDGPIRHLVARISMTQKTEAGG